MFYIASATIFFLILTYLFHKKKFENICHCQRFYNILNNRDLKERKADRYFQKCQNIESSQC